MDVGVLAAPAASVIGALITGAAAWYATRMATTERKLRLGAEQQMADAERRALAHAAEADRIRQQADALDRRTTQMMDDYQEEISRLRRLLAEREGRGS